MSEFHIFVSGQVQGVGFRSLVKTYARRLGITGYVFNLEDGRVEICIQASQELVERLLGEIQKKPGGAVIKKINIELKETKEQYPSFEIRY